MLIKKVTPLFSTALRLMSVALFLSVGLILLAQSSFAQGNPASQPKAPTQLKFIKLYVGNLSAETTEETLRNVFAEFGEVKSVKMGKDGDDNPIGYVEMEADAAEEAIEQLNESELDGNEIVVRKAEPAKDLPQAPAKPAEKAPQPAPQTEPKQKTLEFIITVQELKQRMDAGEKLNLIDVREPEEYHENNLGGQLIPLGKIRVMETEAIDHLKNEELIVMCRSGARSMQAAMMLKQMGFTKVVSLEGGILAWIKVFGL